MHWRPIHHCCNSEDASSARATWLPASRPPAVAWTSRVFIVSGLASLKKKNKNQIGHALVPIGQEYAHGKRHQINPGVQTWHDDRCGARITRPAPFAPKLHGDEESIDRDDQRAKNLAVTVVHHSRNLGEPEPKRSAEESR